MNWRVALIAAAVAQSAWAQQASLRVDQAHAPSARSTLAKAPPQISVAAGDRATVQQLPKDLKEREPVFRALQAGAPAAPPDETLTPSRRDRASVSADEIARLLNEGRAASIDAAAAIASGAAKHPDVSGQGGLEPAPENAAEPPDR